MTFELRLVYASLLAQPEVEEPMVWYQWLAVIGTILMIIVYVFYLIRAHTKEIEDQVDYVREHLSLQGWVVTQEVVYVSRQQFYPFLEVAAGYSKPFAKKVDDDVLRWLFVPNPRGHFWNFKTCVTGVSYFPSLSLPHIRIDNRGYTEKFRFPKTDPLIKNTWPQISQQWWMHIDGQLTPAIRDTLDRLDRYLSDKDLSRLARIEVNGSYICCAGTEPKSIDDFESVIELMNLLETSLCGCA